MHIFLQISVTANVRGAKYNMTCATVSDVCEKVAERTGLRRDLQSVAYRGRLLRMSDTLSNAGVSDGAEINVQMRRKEETKGPLKEQLPLEYITMLKKMAQVL